MPSAPLAKRVAPVSLYQNIGPTKCLQNQLGMARIATVCWCNKRLTVMSGMPLVTSSLVRKSVIFRWFFEWP